MNPADCDGDGWLRPCEVLAVFRAARLPRVTESTLHRAARRGRLTVVRTLGGHRRYRAAEVSGLVDEMRAA